MGRKPEGPGAERARAARARGLRPQAAGSSSAAGSALLPPPRWPPGPSPRRAPCSRRARPERAPPGRSARSCRVNGRRASAPGPAPCPSAAWLQLRPPRPEGAVLSRGRRPGRGEVGGGGALSGRAPDAARRSVTRGHSLPSVPRAEREEGGAGRNGPRGGGGRGARRGSRHLAARSESSPDTVPGGNRSLQARAVLGLSRSGAPPSWTRSRGRA